MRHVLYGAPSFHRSAGSGRVQQARQSRPSLGLIVTHHRQTMADVTSNESAAATEALTCEYAEPDPTSSLASEGTSDEVTSGATSGATSDPTAPLSPSSEHGAPDTDAVDVAGAAGASSTRAKDTDKKRPKKPVTLLSLILSL